MKDIINILQLINSPADALQTIWECIAARKIFQIR